MIIRKIDPATRDWQFGKGLASYAMNEDAINENIKTRLLSWVGDCFFAAAEGIDWKSRLDSGQQQNLSDEVSAMIMKSFGVVAVNSVQLIFDGNNRLETLLYNIDTIFSSSFVSQVEIAAGTIGG